MRLLIIRVAARGGFALVTNGWMPQAQGRLHVCVLTVPREVLRQQWRRSVLGLWGFSCEKWTNSDEQYKINYVSRVLQLGNYVF